MNEDLVRTLLARRESLTVQDLEEEIGYSIVMEWVKGIFIQKHSFSGFVISDEYEEIA